MPDPIRQALLYRRNEYAMWRWQWREEARAGRLWFPYSVSDTWAQTLCMILERHAATPELAIYIDTAGGTQDSFRPCLWLNRRLRDGLKTTSLVVGEATSIGLSYAVCASTRRALPEVKFVVHGEFARSAMRHASGAMLEDHYIADWLARFTKRSYEDWLALVSDGGRHEFGVDEALEWGVIDEIAGGV